MRRKIFFPPRFSSSLFEFPSLLLFWVYTSALLTYYYVELTMVGLDLRVHTNTLTGYCIPTGKQIRD
jgi:hypothetical protein